MVPRVLRCGFYNKLRETSSRNRAANRTEDVLKPLDRRGMSNIKTKKGGTFFD